MKDFYSRTEEHSSRLIRENASASGVNFVTMGSQILYEEQQSSQLMNESVSRVSARVEVQSGPVKKQKKPNISTVVCNHLGFQDILNLCISPIHPGYVAKAEAQNLLLINLCMHAIQCIFVNRGGTEAERNKIVEDIMNRQYEIEDSGQNFNPLCIFPEATTTGGKHLLRFKRGAF